MNMYISFEISISNFTLNVCFTPLDWALSYEVFDYSYSKITSINFGPFQADFIKN